METATMIMDTTETTLATMDMDMTMDDMDTRRTAVAVTFQSATLGAILRAVMANRMVALTIVAPTIDEVDMEVVTDPRTIDEVDMVAVTDRSGDMDIIADDRRPTDATR
jgi:hypothetical protein